LAEELYRNFPNIYKDSNHKPEMAIALTPFEAMCGFREISEIKINISNYPELKVVIGQEVFQLLSETDDNSSEELKKNCLKLLLKSFMDCLDEVANDQIDLLISRLTLEDSTYNDNINNLILRLNNDFPSDRGIFCPLLLNYLQLNEGDGFFMGANEPHAYISGDCIECMAISDNVVRAGLTPKFRDVDTLCRMLKYTSGKPSLLEPVKLNNYTTLYRPDKSICSEFEVEFSKLSSNVSSYTLQRMNCACFLLITQGIDGKIVINDENPIPLIVGNVYFLKANAIVSISTNENPKGVSFFRAHINLG
jgi:mannose-6-phosphate isomerase